MTTNRQLMLAVSALLLSGCAVGPEYQPPAAPPTATAPFIGVTSPLATGDAPRQEWWALYADPALNQLVADALAANTDIRVAVANLGKARAQLRNARSDRLPQTNVATSLTYQRLPELDVLPNEDREFWSADEGLNVAYELDLFGRVRREIEAAHGDVQAANADVDAVRVSVVSATVRAYLDATAVAQQIAVAEQTVALLDKSVRVTTARQEAGRADKLDVIRITALRDQRQAEVAPLQAQRDAALFSLATLTGRAPRALPMWVAAQTTLPRLKQPIPVGDGRALLARRPDVRAAERRLAADTARVGVATADLYPRISLGGSVGSTSYGLGNVFGPGPFRWAAGPLINWSFPNMEPTRARIALAKADTQGALATFDGTVLTALQETETALSAYAHEVYRHAALMLARDEAVRAANIAGPASAMARSTFSLYSTPSARLQTPNPALPLPMPASLSPRWTYSAR